MAYYDTESTSGGSNSSHMSDALTDSVWFNRTVRTRWPEVVGMDAWRASCIVRWGAPYFVTTRPYKTSKSKEDAETTTVDRHRVILWLDAEGCVAVTPQSG